MKLYHILFTIIATTFLYSCEDVIVLNLDETAPRPVIEANLNANDGTCRVSIIQSNGFYDTSDFEKIENATVVLTSETGEEYSFSEISEGEYFTNNIVLSPETEFTITVTGINDNSYQAMAEVPFPVVLDSLESIESDNIFGGSDETEQTYDVFLNWLDIANKINFYRAKITLNGEYLAYSYFLYDDENQDGNDFRLPLFSEAFVKDDVVQIELLSINKATHTYFSELADVQDSGANSSTPYNPQNNFNNDALGYFGIFYSDIKEIIVE